MDHLAKPLRKTLEVLLAGQLGEYVLSNGFKTPAIAVRADSERLPSGTRVSGMEVVVSRYAVQEPVLQYLQQPMDETWSVWLVGWDNSAPLMEATHVILDAYPGTEFQQITVPKSWGPVNQVKILIKNPWVLPDQAGEKDLDGGYFHPYLVLPATKEQKVVDAGGFMNPPETSDEWNGKVDGGVIS